MQLCLTLEHRFLQTPDKNIWTVTQCPYSFYREYLDVFDSVRVISRVFPVERAEANFLPVEGPGVEFYAMPGYKGPFGFLTHFSEVRHRAQNAVPPGSAVILRVHSQIANSVEHWLTRRGQRYSLEVTADPYDVLSPAANSHPVAPIARRYFTRRLQKQCQRALAVSYVTQSYLQQRYPPTPDQFVKAVSDTSLPPECYASQRRTALHDPSCLRVVFVGTLGSLYKGPDVLIDAVALCQAQGTPVRVRFVGSGDQMGALESRAVRLGVAAQVEFAGNVTAGEPVRRELDQADVFVLPSRAEGVPRAMLEAMARGLPCIGSTVGGIPELLDDEDLVPLNDPAALAAAMTRVFLEPAKLQRMSARNLAKAAGYSAEILADQRRDFYRAVKELTIQANTDRNQGWSETLSPTLYES